MFHPVGHIFRRRVGAVSMFLHSPLTLCVLRHVRYNTVLRVIENVRCNGKFEKYHMEFVNILSLNTIFVILKVG